MQKMSCMQRKIKKIMNYIFQSNLRLYYYGFFLHVTESDYIIVNCIVIDNQ